jgi:uncharacterized protein YqeY
MPLLKKIEQDIIEALKAGDKLRVSVLRGLKSDMKYRQISLGSELKDEQAIEVVNSAAKRRRESIELFQKGDRDDLADKESQELNIISTYMPQQLGEEELRAIILDAIKESGADSTQKIGLLMKVLMPKIKGKADGKMVNRLATEILAN